MLAVPWAVARKFGDDQAVALVIGIAGGPPADRDLVRDRGLRTASPTYGVFAVVQVRHPEQEITASFTEAAGEDPLAGRQ